MAGFGWAGAAGAVNDGQMERQKFAADLETQLAEREYRRRQLLFQEAQEERLRQQNEQQAIQFQTQQAEAERLRRQQTNTREAQAKILEGVLTKQVDLPTGRLMLAREGVVSPLDAMKEPAQPTGDTQWVVGPDGKLTHRVPAEGDKPYEKPPTPSAGPQAPVRVETMENGRRVIKFLHPSQVMGQTFEDQPTATANRVLGTERTALNFYNRAKQADDAIIQGGYEERFAQAGLPTQIRGSLPNIAQSPEQQAYRAAQRAFTEARLRKESGAAVPPTEYENDARTYFAQPGDSAAVIAQKRMARQAVLDGIAFSAGGAYEEYYGEPAKKNAAGVSGAPSLKWDPVTKKWVK